MADSLAQALLALPIQPVETPYGITALNISKNIPNMIDPYGNPWGNLAIGLGSVLTSALLGYQARQQALEENATLQPLITQALQANSMEQLDTLLQQEGANRLAPVATQLKLALLERGQEAQEAQNKLQQQLQLELIRQGYVPESMKSQFPEAASGALSPMDRKELAIYQQKLQMQQSLLGGGADAGSKKIAEMRALTAFLGTPEGEQALAAQSQLTKATSPLLMSQADLDERQQRNFEFGLRKKAFEEELQRLNPEVSAAIRNETTEAIAIGNQARQLADKIRTKIGSYPELKLAQRFSTAGAGLREELSDLQDLVLRVRTGAAAPLLEQYKIGSILTGTFEAGPETASALLDKFASRSFEVSADRLAGATINPSSLVDLARNASRSNTIVPLQPQQFELPALREKPKDVAAPVSTPFAYTREELLAELARRKQNVNK